MLAIVLRSLWWSRQPSCYTNNRSDSESEKMTWQWAHGQWWQSRMLSLPIQRWSWGSCSLPRPPTPYSKSSCQMSLLPALTTAGQSGCLSVACTHPSFLHLHFYPGHSFVLFSITFRKHIQASPGSVDIFQTPPMHSPDSLSPGPHLQVWITFAWSTPPSPCCQELCGLSLLGLDTYWPSPSLV